MNNSQEFLHTWEKNNNPFYPQEMRWDRVKVNQMLSEYESQKTGVDNPREFLIQFITDWYKENPLISDEKIEQMADKYLISIPA